ncbi:MAG: FHA domain-containing protein [Chitinophagaceae bacterium]
MPEFKIGRNKDLEIVMGDPTVSKVHAVLTVAGEIYSVRDLNSTNGTYVNGNRITTTTLLQPDDILKVGNTVVFWKKYIPRETGSQKTIDKQKKPGQTGNKNDKVVSPWKKIPAVTLASTLVIALIVTTVIYFFRISSKDELRLTDTWICNDNCGSLLKVIFSKASDKAGSYSYTYIADKDSVVGKFRINTDDKIINLSPGLSLSPGITMASLKTEINYKYELAKNILSLTELDGNSGVAPPLKLVKLR